tara:strand:- start:86 stop:358 length:273 start_codon:yes stop_codon:yes gene_type:complete
MRINLNDFLTDDDIHTLWGIAGRIIDSGAIIDDQDYEISFSLLKDEPNTYYESLSEGKDYGSKVDALVDSMGVTDKKVSTTHTRKDLDLL